MRKYDHVKIEAKWRKEWERKKIYVAKEDFGKPKCYVLDMFPYPSGEGLHVGHPKGYVATDIYSRFKRMSGFNVLHPMGWDAFGLPAENFALKNKTHPKLTVDKNIKYYKEQMSILGFDYDWEREINTTDPDYYKWTQWIFLKFFEKGLAYESFEPINWCPSCQTGLANEDLENGKCERCGSVVEKKPMRQWMLKITEYAERLYSGLESLNWPESIKESQRNWIGKSQGAEIDFKIKKTDGTIVGKITVFTTRADTLFGVGYLVLSPEHPFIPENQALIANFENVADYLQKSKNKSEIERTSEGKDETGVRLDGLSAINPANNEEVAIWVADYVLSSYGTGAVMAVPAHDRRDFEFAKRFGLPIKQVVAPFFIDKDYPPVDGKEFVPRRMMQVIVRHPSDEKIIQLKGKKMPWRTLVTGGLEEGETYEEAAAREVKEETGYKNFRKIEKIGWRMESLFYAAHKNVNRQAFMEVFHIQLADLERDDITADESEMHDVTWVPASDLGKTFWPSVRELSEIATQIKGGPHPFTGPGKMMNSGKYDGWDSEEAGKAIISLVSGRTVTKYKLRDWVFSRQRYWGEPIPLIHCEKCGVVPVPEKDLPVKLPNVKNYAPTGTGESPLAAIKKWVNIRCPKCRGAGRRETNTMPQWAGSSWFYLRYMDPKNGSKFVDPEKEKYWSRVDVYVGGAEHATRHLIYARFWHKFLHDIGAVSGPEPANRLHYVGLILGEDGQKMSKRFYNVVNPDDVVKIYGADTFRIHEMFMGPFGQSSSWDTRSILGSRKFIERVWRLAGKVVPDDDAGLLVNEKKRTALETLLHVSIGKITADIENFNFNTAISCMMILSREFNDAPAISETDFSILLRLLAPFAPHIAEELWRMSGNKKTIHLCDWPKSDPRKVALTQVKIAVQVNGRIRAEFAAPPDAGEEEIKKMALSNENVKKWLNNGSIRRIIFVRNRLMNFVTE